MFVNGLVAVLLLQRKCKDLLRPKSSKVILVHITKQRHSLVVIPREIASPRNIMQ